MRHRKSGKKLGRTWEHRKAMFRNMAKSLIVHERIRTTVPKAKELSKIMDKLVSLAIRNDLSAKRQAYKVLENHKLVQRLFNEIGPRFSDGKGGYTRVVKFAMPRAGDSAAMALIEFSYFESQVEDKIKPKTAAPAPGAAAAPGITDETPAVPESAKDPETPKVPETSGPAPDDIADQAGPSDPGDLGADQPEESQAEPVVSEIPDDQDGLEEKSEAEPEKTEQSEDSGPDKERP